MPSHSTAQYSTAQHSTYLTSNKSLSTYLAHFDLFDLFIYLCILIMFLGSSVDIWYECSLGDKSYRRCSLIQRNRR